MSSVVAVQCILCLFLFGSLSVVVDGRTTQCPLMANATNNAIVHELPLPDDLSMTTLSIDGNGSCQSDLSGNTTNGTRKIISITSSSAEVFSIVHQGSVSKSTKDAIDYALNIVVLPALISMGICGNIASFRTLLNQNPRKPITVYLMGLSITDTAAVVFQLSVWFANVLTLHHRRLGLEIYAALFTPVIVVLRASSFRASGYITVVLSIERAIAVTLPFKVKDMFLDRHPRKIIMALCAFVLLAHLPYLFQYKMQVVTDHTTNESALIILPTEFHRGSTFFTHYDFPVQIIMRVLPVVLVLVCNLITIISLRMSQRTRRDLSNKDQEELNVTRLLVTISIIFLICTTPFAIHGILDKFIANYGFSKKEHHLYVLVALLSAFLSVFNCCVNFIVYMFMSKRFRETFYRTWRCADILRRRARRYDQDNLGESDLHHTPRVVDVSQLDTGSPHSGF